jgi:ubiquinone/menaquinone biosynthesis C-methylase UbiE
MKTGESLMGIYGDVPLLKTLGRIISLHSTSPKDIREVALQSLDLSCCRTIMDLGCGSGFFARALAGRVHPDALIIGVDMCRNNEESFLKVCAEMELEATFCDSGIDMLDELDSRSVDLIICSYALYFFPESIEDIARILKPNGVFITITHSASHMVEISEIIKELKPGSDSFPIPFETLIERFSDENGYRLLRNWFGGVKMIEYENALVFDAENSSDLIRYIRYKKDFFTPGLVGNKTDFHEKLESRIRQKIIENGSVRITKNDTVFICSDPL